MGYDYISNRVDRSTLRTVQVNTMNTLKDILVNSFGPMGSTTIIRKPNAFNRYTKDGHTILSNVMFKGEIESAVREDVEALTRHTVLGIGDSSTSIVILAALLFERLADYEQESNDIPSLIIRDFKKITDDMIKIIESKGRECTLDDIYKIALISTNNDEDLSNMLKVVYEKFGMDVFIDVAISNTDKTILKEFDGLTLDSGFCDAVFVNNKQNNSCVIRNANIYAFQDPIDTQEMIIFFDKIIYDNIYSFFNKEEKEKSKSVIPTIIMAPKISRDLSMFMDTLVEFMGRYNVFSQKPPIEIITNITDMDTYLDIARLCGCKLIQKYIDPKIQEEDIKKGLAPIPETIHNFAGYAEEVISDMGKTKFINPKKMYNKDGSESDLYKSIIDFLEAEVKKATEEGESMTKRGTLKRRLNSIKGNMVEIDIGGITVADRDAKRDLLEDAVLNCRSASQNGVGWGANFEGLNAIIKLCSDISEGRFSEDYIRDGICDYLDGEGDDIFSDIDEVGCIHSIVLRAYVELVKILYTRSCSDASIGIDILKDSISVEAPVNLITLEFNKDVLSSIKTDPVVLDTLAQLLTLMITSNQFFTPTYLDNLYDQVDTSRFSSESDTDNN